MTTVSWRPARLRDALWWLRLRNEPQARAMSLNNRRIGLLEHLWWYVRNLRSRDSCLYVAYDGPFGERTAQVRYQRANGHAEVSLVVDPRYRDRRIGRAMLSATGWEACRALAVKTVQAVTLIENEASRQVLLAAGYQLTSIGRPEASGGKIVTTYTWSAK